jgi:D-alanyl-D-alanine dipeptidase
VQRYNIFSFYYKKRQKIWRFSLFLLSLRIDTYLFLMKNTNTLLFVFTIICFTAISCVQTNTSPPLDTYLVDQLCAQLQDEPSHREQELEGMGLIDVSTLDPGIMVQMVYATPYNFMGKVLYEDLNRAYLQPDAGKKLLKAYKALKQLRPDLSFVVYDAARPVSIQREMWNMVKGTQWDYYVANPAKGGGMHNFGTAVDLSLIDCTGKSLDMGTPYDYFGEEANTDKEEELVKKGLITSRELKHRLLLRKVMTEAGFHTIKSEWWHFNSCSLDEAQQRYNIIE